MLSAAAIVHLQDERTRAWHEKPEGVNEAPDGGNVNGASGFGLHVDSEPDFLALAARQHRANFDLWHIEDQARAPGAADAELADVKRRIDCTNQLRNDLAEQLDRALLDWLEPQGLPNAAAALHSESPGLMIDRLSILTLKIYHTSEETERKDAPDGHCARNQTRLSVLIEQRADLAACLDALWRETLAGVRRFKLYKQLKMYNDPSLNPAIYRSSPPGETR
jgi:Protein of unknown function (DUF4254)